VGEISGSIVDLRGDRTSGLRNRLHLMAIHCAAAERGVYIGLLINRKERLENVAIANALQLEAGRATPALCRFNYDAMPSLMSPNSITIYYSVFAADTLLYDVTYWPLPRDLDLWPWTFAAYPLWRDETLYLYRTTRVVVIAITVFDLTTAFVQHVLSVGLGSGIIFTKFDLRQLIRVWIIAFLCWYVISRCDLDLDPLIFKVRGTSSATCSVSTKFERNQAIPVEILIILRIFVHVMSRCDLDLWPLDLELLRHFGCHASKLHTKFERNRIIHGWVTESRFRVQF